MSTEAGSSTSSDRKLTPRLIVLAIVVPFAVVGAGIAALVALSGSNPSGDVIVACQDAVRDRLKAPSTADFKSSAAEPTPDRWVVVGTVDAQNSFGATVRTQFTCRVAWDGPTNSAVLQSVDLGR